MAVSNGFRFAINDLVDVFVGTGSNIRGSSRLFAGERFFLMCAKCGEAIAICICVHRCTPHGTTLHTDANIAQMFGIR